MPERSLGQAHRSSATQLDFGVTAALRQRGRRTSCNLSLRAQEGCVCRLDKGGEADTAGCNCHHLSISHVVRGLSNWRLHGTDIK